MAFPACGQGGGGEGAAVKLSCGTYTFAFYRHPLTAGRSGFLSLNLGFRLLTASDAMLLLLVRV